MAQNPKELTDERSIVKMRTPAELSRMVDSLRRARNGLENEWKLNLRFYKGDQYSYFNRSANRIERIPTEEGERARYQVRMVTNQIAPSVQSLLAKLTKSKPTFNASPGSGSDHDVKAAELAERLFDYWWDDFALTEKLDEALLWAIITGQGFWKITWDAQAGKPMKFAIDPEGQPITNDVLKDFYEAELAQMGLPLDEMVTYLGDIKVEVLSPFDVYLDPSAKTFDDCKYAICVHHLDPDEIKARWGVDVAPDAVPGGHDTTIPFSGQEGLQKTVKRVYIGYFLPSPTRPQGRYVVWLDNHDKFLDDQPWPYPTHKLPLVKFPGMRVPGSIYDDSEVTQARPLQKELNRTVSQLVMFKNLTVRPQWTSPINSLRTRMTTEPGAVWEYNPIGGHRPEPVQMPQIPPYIFDFIENISGRIRDTFALTEVTEGVLPPNLEAGVAIDLLQEMATDRLAPKIQLIELALERAGELMLNLAQAYYVEPRLLKIRGSGGGVQVRRFTQADLASGVSINVETGSALPRTRAGKQARIQRMVEMGILRPDQALRYMDTADMTGVAKLFRADEDRAYREHDMLVQGQPLNPAAMLMAQQQAIQMMQNPQPQVGPNGEPLPPVPLSPEEAMAMVQDAALEPGIADNHGVHLESHSLFVKSMEFEALPIELQNQFFSHVQKHMMAMQPEPEILPPRVTYQIKGTAGVTASSEILKRAGVEVTPEIMAEPPLETWVTDSIDKVDKDEAGNDPLTGMDMQLNILEAMQKAQNIEASQSTSRVSLIRELANARAAVANADLAEKKAKAGVNNGS